MQDIRQESYTFDDYDINLQTRELRKNGQIIAIENKAFDFLSYLVVHHNKLVLKEEIQKELWGNRPISESVLSRCAMKARRAIDDDGQTQQRIKTISGKGFRFVCKISSANTDKSTKVTPIARTFNFKTHLNKRTLATAFTFLTITLSILGYTLFNNTYNNRAIQITLAPLATTGMPIDARQQHGLIEALSFTLHENLPDTIQIDNPLKYNAHSYSLNEARSWLYNYNKDKHLFKQSYAPLIEINTLDNAYIATYEWYQKAEFSTQGKVYALEKDALSQILAHQFNKLITKSSITNIPDEQTKLSFISIDTARKYWTEEKSNNKGISETSELYEQADAEYTLGLTLNSQNTIDILLDKKSDILEPKLLMRSLWLAGRVATKVGEYAEARDYLEKAMDVSRGLDSPRCVSDVLISVAELEMLTHNYDSAKRILHRVIEQEERKEQRKQKAYALLQLGKTTLAQGHINLAKKQVGLALHQLQLYDKINNPAISEALTLLARISEEQGYHEESGNLLREAIDIAHQSQDANRLIEALTALARLKQRQGQNEYSLSLLDKATKLNTAGTSSAITHEIEMLRHCALASDNPKSLENLEAQFTYAIDNNWKISAAKTAYELGSIYLRKNSSEKANHYANATQALSRDINNLRLEAQAIRLRGNIEHNLENFENASQLYYQAFALASSTENPLLSTDIHIDLAYLALQSGNIREGENKLNSLMHSNPYHRIDTAKAFLLYKKGLYKEAFAQYSEAILLAKESWLQDATPMYSIYKYASASSNNTQKVSFVDLLLAEN